MRGALKDKTILLVTHQVDFLHNVDLILVSLYSSYTHTYMCFYVNIKPFFWLILPGHERGDDCAVGKVQ